NKSTDTEHEIKLDSNLISAHWISRKAIAGQKAKFEVITSFVGEGARIKIKGKSEGGENLGKIKDIIKKNIFHGEFDIPEDAELGDRVFFEVKLPKNSIEGESDRIPIFPKVRVFNMQWSAKEARRGDNLTLSAETSGLKDHDEVTVIIYEHDQDSAHDKIAEIPATVSDNKIELKWEYEYHEDTDEIPTQEELDKYSGKYNPPEYFFTVKVENTEFGLKQESGLLEYKSWIEIEFRSEDGTPMADDDYIVTTADGQEHKGKLDKEGWARIDNVPPGPAHVEFPISKTNNDEVKKVKVEKKNTA
ncbi:MAG: hypothetical protein U9R56_04580, partial [candidate division Zixibacteria bacterium]|nr:hypothetical protein [candidate division Zixibacteria bacterium]